MNVFLTPHPDSPPSPVTAIQVLSGRLGDGKLSLVYDVAGDLGRLRMPPSGDARREDGLWQHTCFEAFVRPPEGETYFEFNLSPAGSWAAYRFDGYRRGMMQADLPPPIVKSLRRDDHMGVVVGIELGALPELVPWATWQAGLSAVIEAEDGTKSYWALKHPPGKPDFHHPDCFALQLPAPDGA